MGYHCATKKDTFKSVVVKCVLLETVMLREINQTNLYIAWILFNEKNKLHIKTKEKTESRNIDLLQIERR